MWHSSSYWNTGSSSIVKIYGIRRFKNYKFLQHWSSNHVRISRYIGYSFKTFLLGFSKERAVFLPNTNNRSTSRGHITPTHIYLLESRYRRRPRASRDRISKKYYELRNFHYDIKLLIMCSDYFSVCMRVTCLNILCVLYLQHKYIMFIMYIKRLRTVTHTSKNGYA